MDQTQLEELRDAQLQLEDDLAAEGVQKYWSDLEKAKRRGLETMSKPMQHAMRTFLEPLAEGLQERYIKATQRPGRKNLAISLIYWASVDVLAFITLRSVLDSISQPRRFSTAAMRLGREVEDELRFQAFEQDNPGLFHTIQKHVKESPRSYNRDYRRKVMIHASNKYDVFWEKWSDTQKAAVGVWLLDSMVEYTGLVESHYIKQHRGTRTKHLLRPTPALVGWLDSQHSACEGLTPRRAPMICPPAEWTNTLDGGYLTKRLRQPLLWLVGQSKAETMEMYSREQMPLVYESVNALGRTAYRVERSVHETAARLWDMGAELPNISRVEVELPPRPAEGATQAEWSSYKVRAREVRNHNDKMTGRRMATSLTLEIARRNRGRALWFPHKLDFRSRTYTQPNYLEPQGADLAKGMLRLDAGEPLTDRGRYWLHVHLANNWGVDKVHFDDRVEWVRENEDMIARCAEDPLEHRDWYDAEAPFQFLAACNSWQHDREGRAVTLPVMVDGSCNGIQHLAAMSCDASAGRLVNLAPSELPGDVYQVVADRLADKVEAEAKNPTELRTRANTVRWTAQKSRFLALAWTEFGLSRKLAKRPTMILPYNGTPLATERYILEHLEESVRKGAANPFGDDLTLAAQWLTHLIRPAMREVVPGPVSIMEWTRELAKPVAAANAPLVWSTPAGFTVRQRYRETASRRIKTRVGDKVYQLSLSEATDAINHRQQAQSFAPNWIHSYDAAALHRTVAHASREGIQMVTNHDSYGCHPNQMDRLGEILREQFVACYKGVNAMQKLREDVARHARIGLDDTPEPPSLGSLDIELVLSSPFFFG